MVTASLSSETTFRPATSTTVNGEYSLRLPPGRYVVSTPNGNRSAQQTLQITGPAVQDLTLLDPPSAPPLVVAAIGNRQATVSWSQPVDDGGSPVTSFTVRAMPGSSICTTQTRSCTVTGLENGRDHQFFVTADNAVGSSVSSLASNSVIPSASLPRPVANVRVVPADGAVDVIWSASPSDDVIEYTAVASPSGRSCSTATLTCSISGLRNGTAYTITVTARSQAGSSDAVSAGRMAIPTAVASAPRDVQVRPKPSALHVRWNPPRDDGGTKISEYVATAWPGGKTCTTRTTSCVIRALAPKTDYSITVRAMNSAGAGAISPGSAITRPMPGKPAPGRVAGLRVQIRKSAATVRWKASQRATSYLVRLTRPGRRSGTWLMVRRPQVQFSVERGTHIAQVRAVGTGGKGAMRQRTFRVQ
jgi:hypothetical protein